MSVYNSSLQQSTGSGIGREIGSQYDNVKVVADNMTYVIAIANIIDSGLFDASALVVQEPLKSSIINVSNISSSVVAVANNEADISILADNIDDIIALGALTTEIQKAATIADYSGLVHIVGSDLANEYIYIEDNGTLTEPVNATSGSSAIRTVAENIASVNITALSIDNINTVAPSTDNIDLVGPSITDVNTVAANITDVQNAFLNAQKAEQYAIEPENSTGSVTGTYSALHYYLKSAAVVEDWTNFKASGGTISGPVTMPSLQLDGGIGAQGTMTWNADEETVDIVTNGSVLQVGQEIVWHVRNNTGSTISNGTVVMATGTLGASGRITVAPMVADGSVEAKFLLGVATEDIEAGGDGKVTHFGKVRGINTTAWAEGAVLYADPAVAGGLTDTMPAAPNLKLPIAMVISSTHNGTLAVRASVLGSTIGDNHDVEISSVQDGDILVYESTTNRWINTNVLDMGTLI